MPCRAVPCRAVPCRAVPYRALRCNLGRPGVSSADGGLPVESVARRPPSATLAGRSVPHLVRQNTTAEPPAVDGGGAGGGGERGGGRQEGYRGGVTQTGTNKVGFSHGGAAPLRPGSSFKEAAVRPDYGRSLPHQRAVI